MIKLIALVLFMVAALVEIGVSIALMKGKIAPNPHAAITTISGVVFAGIGLLLFFLAE